MSAGGKELRLPYHDPSLRQAQSACSTTTGSCLEESVVGSNKASAASCVPLFPSATAKVAPKITEPRVRHRATLDDRPKCRIGLSPQLRQLRPVQRRVRKPALVAGQGWLSVSGTNILTNVAPVHVCTEIGSARVGDSRLNLDGEVRETARGIDYPGFDDGTSRTGFQAECACSALIKGWNICLQWKTTEDLGKKEPRPELVINDARVLADLAEPRVLRVHPLLNRSGVNIRDRLKRCPAGLVHPLQQFACSSSDDSVVVETPRVA